MGQCVAQGYRSTGLGVTIGVIVNAPKNCRYCPCHSSGRLPGKNTRLTSEVSEISQSYNVATMAEYRCCFCGERAVMPDSRPCNGIPHAACPEGGTWWRSLSVSEPLAPERRALIKQVRVQADVRFELTGKIHGSE